MVLHCGDEPLTTYALQMTTEQEMLFNELET